MNESNHIPLWRIRYDYRRRRGLCLRCGRIKDHHWQCPTCHAQRAARKMRQSSTLGARIRQHRKQIGYTQGEYGVLLGITGDHVGGLENGTWKARPSLKLRRRLAYVLDCLVDALDEA